MLRSIAASTGPDCGDSGELARIETAQARLISHARLGLSFVALSIVLLQPSRPELIIALAVLLLYGASNLFRWCRFKANGLRPKVQSLPWMDFLSYAIAIEASGGPASPLLTFILFPVAVVAFERGPTMGVRAAVTCAALFAGMSVFLESVAPDEVDVPVPAIVTSFLFLVGALLLALWGRAEVGLMRRLALLSDVTRLFGPCTSLGHTVSRLSHLLRSAFGAEQSLIVIACRDAGEWRLCRSFEEGATPAGGGNATLNLRDLFRAQREGEPVASAEYGPGLPDAAMAAEKLLSMGARDADRLVLAEIARLLEGKSYVSLPLKAQNRHVGRLVLVSRGRGFSRAEILCLVQTASHAALLIDNVRLVDELTSTVASDERKRISRDLHDGAIQPYIGLKLGLEALRRVAGEGRFTRQLDELITMAGDGVEELRRYVRGLKGNAHVGEARSVLPAIRQQAEKFSKFYGIEAEVVADADIEMTDAMCGEIVNIVREGLANIRRHTSAEKATISLHAECGMLLLEFINDESTGRITPEDFLPRSIAERARELGGSVNVYCREGGLTAVAVEIPF